VQFFLSESEFSGRGAAEACHGERPKKSYFLSASVKFIPFLISFLSKFLFVSTQFKFQLYASEINK
jgi:hypothetical protein